LCEIALELSLEISSSALALSVYYFAAPTIKITDSIFYYTHSNARSLVEIYSPRRGSHQELVLKIIMCVMASSWMDYLIFNLNNEGAAFITKPVCAAQLLSERENEREKILAGLCSQFEGFRQRKNEIWST